MHNLYEIKISGKNHDRFVKQLLLKNIAINRITHNQDNSIILVDKTNLNKINKIKTTYEIEIVRYYGIEKYKYIYKKNKVLLITLFFGLILIYFLSNVIFDVEVVHSNKKLETLILNEVNEQGIKKFHFKVSYKTKEKIKNNILNEYKDKIEWLEIKNVGTKYIINVEERIINNIQIENMPRDIIASKDGIIVDITASKGEIVKKINDYVRKGDIIISGSITKNGEIVNKIKAEGTIFAETWYQITIDIPITYYETKKTGNNKKSLVLQIFNHSYKINVFDQNKFKKIITIKHSLLPISLSLVNSEEIRVTDQIYTVEEAINKAQEICYNKLKEKLDASEKILLEKVLNTTINNDKVKVAIFFKVYEDITNYKKIEEEIIDE